MTKKNFIDPKTQRPIIIRKKVIHAHEEHGGAWKVAYADFMTAMMAFFLLLWLLSENPDKEKLEGLAKHFAETNISLTSYGSDDVLEGESLPEEPSDQPQVTEQKSGTSTTDAPDGTSDLSENGPAHDGSANPWSKLRKSPNSNAAGNVIKDTINDLKSLTQDGGPLDDLAQHLIVKEKENSILIEIVDAGSSPLFLTGSAALSDANQRIIMELAKVLAPLSQNLNVTGHTDAVPYRGRNNYSNWELSSERALATRRALIGSGVAETQIFRVSGVADKELINKNNPSAPENRRVTIEITNERR